MGMGNWGLGMIDWKRGFDFFFFLKFLSGFPSGRRAELSSNRDLLLLACGASAMQPLSMYLSNAFSFGGQSTIRVCIVKYIRNAAIIIALGT